MNLRIETEIGFQGSADDLEEMLVAFADVLKNAGYGNDNDDDAVLKSYIRVKKIDDDEVIVVVIPLKDREEKEIGEEDA